MKRLVALCALVAFVLALAPTAFGAGGNEKDTFVQLLAINDFHGNLQPPTGSAGRIATGPAGRPSTRAACSTSQPGSRACARPIRTPSRSGAGDLIGASPLISGLFHDEPTIESMNALGLDVTGVGNHEFDEGVDELLRMQFGNQLGGNGCHPVDGCQDGTPFGGSLFQYLAANVFYEHTENTILPPYEIHKVGNAKIAFIGLTLEGTPLIVTPAGVAGLEFRPEIGVINDLVADLRANQGVRAFVVLIHQGGLAERAVPARVSGLRPLRQLQRRHRPDRERALAAGGRRRLGAHASAVHLSDQREARHERILVRPADHGHRSPHRPPDEGHRKRDRAQRHRHA